ncbi:uracil phosphoribosyltransferase [Myxococcota bacterium]|jgi:uracil phosphoribosyltransferase|nr:uracil phosphoribosyltransferase [Myxococcota bacterium]MBU1410113.1 uracil phosphoribosyltransferase [Myxococcota bacterium]MBU1509370.1 uracil phosphoribosyltransferase [Myxococcota bacterium]PKN26393.1 MAG: uracil phosphoribosyltransferase [Deltaproteobacteria bacterium HGW-Deltaproteobacteria-22]
MTKLILRAMDLDGFLTERDHEKIRILDARYEEAMSVFRQYDPASDRAEEVRDRMIGLYSELGHVMHEMLGEEKNIHVFSFETPPFIHGEASRLIAKLRDVRTEQPEFVYYIQRAYELLFNMAFQGTPESKHHILVKTPVGLPTQQYAIHKIPQIDDCTGNAVMCVMLRAALLPSMIVSKEIQEYHSGGYVTPFALFKIGRDDRQTEQNMSYVLDLKKSYFNLEMLDGKDWFFADPMNATGGSMITVVKFLKDQGVTPRSVKFFNVISAMKGCLRIARAVENVEIYTLWMDPSLNEKAYILPGVGDAGDRINGRDSHETPRDIIQLIADYGTRITALYRAQIRSIERTVLG